MKKSTILFSSSIILIIDRIIKCIIQRYLSISITVIPNFFFLTYIENTGGAWGILSHQTVILIIVSLACLLFLLKEIFVTSLSKNVSLAYTLILGGLLGNLMDRMMLGYVIDYIQIVFGSYTFPIFNFADICIVLGAILLIIDYIRGDKNEF